MNITTLREITAHNWRLVGRLGVAPDQAELVASNLYSLVEAAYGFTGELAELTIVPLAIYAGNEPVGFVMYNAGPEQDRFFIMRLMVDRERQRRGYCREDLRLLLERFRAIPQAREVAVSYLPNNDVAAQLYRSLGFEEVGVDDEGGEMVAVLDLNPQDELWESLWR